MNARAFHERHAGLFPRTALDDKRVLLIGAGSVGSFLAELLIRAGVLHLVVVDKDCVTHANLCRTIYEAEDVGAPKVEALKRHLEAIRSDVQVEARHVDLGDVEDDDLSSWIAECDLVVAVTDHPPTQSRVAALSYQVTPAVFAGVYAKGSGGEVVYTLPAVTPCYHCVLGGIRGEHRPNRGRLDYGLSTGELLAEPALGIDILHVTVCAAKLALALLLRETQCAVTGALKPGHSVLFVGNQVDWIWKEPFETVWARAERRNDCVCRIRPDESSATRLEKVDDLFVLPDAACSRECAPQSATNSPAGSTL